MFFNRIRDLLRQVEDDYDIVLIDCPPQLGYLTMAAVCASTSLLMTIIPERVDLAFGEPVPDDGFRCAGGAVFERRYRQL